MKTALECISCFLNQSLLAARKLSLSESVTESLVRELLRFLGGQEWQLPPPVLAREVQRLIRKYTECDDPYYEQKLADTNGALNLLSEIESKVERAEWPFLPAVQFSIAGNAIDFGAANGWDPAIERTFRNALTGSLDRDVVTHLEHAVSRSKRVLFLADNCGEIVFDRPLLNLIGPDKVTVAVRGEPVLNDATMEDARRSGLTERFRVVSNGSDVPGTWLDDCSQDFKTLFNEADYIIAKGQGNYECLNTLRRDICFLFMVKCPFVAERVGMSKGSHAIYLSAASRK